VLFLGSNIGNFDPPQAAALLRNIRAALRPGDTLLLGLDLVKPEAVLQLAYDDPLGVTAAFNKNLLTRLNTELGADFDLDRFAHQARWVEQESRIEMHLVSRRAQTVRIRGANCTISFEDGESIWTENSYKYYPEDADRLGADAGFRAVDQWVDGGGRFALTLFEA
jgi:L-histidine N-alpha-methyltransferase